MASLLRQIVAGPRSRHPEAGLDLCYVTDQIIATSGPSATYPQRAYRNPLDQLVKFLDYKHGKDWSIWEFRAEGTGYPDDQVYGRIRHYPWPDHHPPPFKLVPMIIASMRNWLVEEQKEGEEQTLRKGRVVVVHCKAGKGRSGTMACSYLISECGWKPEEALARFTERRMRPGFGQGISIPSQLRWVGYVNRWAHSGKVYVERQIEIMEVHVWGLRNGVKVQVEGYIEEGKEIKVFHLFTKKERMVVEGNTPGGSGFTDMISDMAGFQNQNRVSTGASTSDITSTSTPSASKTPTLITPQPIDTTKIQPAQDTVEAGSDPELGGLAVIFKPSTPIIIPNSDINIDFERRNRASVGWTMVTSVAHVWFNAYFEGHGPENNGKPNANGLFEIEWDAMDGIKGSSQKGTRSFDRLAVVWRAVVPEDGGQGVEGGHEVIHQPGVDSPVPQMKPADWKGSHNPSPDEQKDLGLRTEDPGSANISKASSIKEGIEGGAGVSMADVEGVKSSGAYGEDDLGVNLEELPQPQAHGSEPTLEDVNKGLDTASTTTGRREGC